MVYHRIDFNCESLLIANCNEFHGFGDISENFHCKNRQPHLLMISSQSIET